VRYSLLVAVRDYLEHTKTKGFWVGIAMVPVLLLVLPFDVLWNALASLLR